MWQRAKSIKIVLGKFLLADDLLTWAIHRPVGSGSCLKPLYILSSRGVVGLWYLVLRLTTNQMAFFRRPAAGLLFRRVRE